MCCEWWRWWWKEIPVKKELLPQDGTCFIIESKNIPVAAGFLYTLDNPLIAYGPTWVVSNPEYKEKDRRQVLELLITRIEDEAKKLGVKQLFTVCGNRFMQQIHKKSHSKREASKSYVFIEKMKKSEPRATEKC